MTVTIHTIEGTFTAPDPYVPERVRAAFKELEELGYDTGGNCGCCQSCVHGAMERAGVEKYVFYHSQSAEHLSEEGQVYLGWQGNAQEIIRVLAKYGLNPDWDGRDDRNILITVPEAKGVDPHVDESTWVPVDSAGKLAKSIKLMAEANKLLDDVAHLSRSAREHAAAQVEREVVA